jgi:hypothetical protein
MVHGAVQVIDDRNRAIAVVTTAGAWADVLEILTQLLRRGQIREPPPNTIDLTFDVAQLATIFHDYASPGYAAVKRDLLREPIFMMKVHRNMADAVLGRKTVDEVFDEMTRQHEQQKAQ